MVIRAATPRDIPELADLARRAWLDAFGDSVDADDAAAEVEETRSERYFANALLTKTILVAEAGGALLGYAQAGNVEIPEVDARVGDKALHRLYVDPEAQGRGLGPKLLEAALEHPSLADADRVFLTVWEQNERAVRLYERFGFRTVGTTTFTIGSEVVEDLVMLLDRGRR